MEADTNLVISGLLDFTRQKAAPLEEALGETLHNPRLAYDGDGREVPAITEARRKVRMAAARAGYFQAFVPESVGGGGLGHATSFQCWEALYLEYGPGDRLPYSAISHWASGPSVLWERASEHLKREVFPRVLSGEWQGCFGMSEPDAGSDAWRMQTRAVRDGDDWLINGSKQWTSFSPTAEYAFVFAVTSPDLVERRKGGITCFYVPVATPGFKVESIIKLFGEVGGKEGILSFTDMRVPDAHRVGEIDRGFELAMTGATQGRFYNTARSIGLSRWALERSIEYARQRHASGKPIAEFQMIQAMLADSAVEIYAAKTMGLDAARRAERGEDIRREAAMAKLHATNTAVRVLDRAMQIHGGMGLTNELRLHEGWKTARAIRIADGTDEILRRTVARELLKGNVGF